jgi:hypothetical protein
MCLWKNHALFLSHRSIILWYSPLMLYLGWLGACLHHVMITNQSPQALWSFGFWLVISLYALVNNVSSLCMIMAIIALLVDRSQSFASLRLYWVWALLVHPTPKNQSYSKESIINFYAWHFKPFQANFHVLPFKTFKILLILWHCFSLWGRSGRVSYLPYWIKYPLTCMLHLLVTNFARELVRPL